MSIAFLERHARKREVRRLENIKEQFLNEYKVLCEKYRAQLVPLFVPQGGGKYQLTMQIDAYQPIPQEQIDAIANANMEKMSLEKNDREPQQQ